MVVAAPDAGTRREVRRVAEDLGFAVHEAADGVEAVESAVRLRPAVVVLDRILPRLRAEEVAERLRTQPATRTVPLVLLASGRTSVRVASLFRECLSRPVDRRMLAVALERLGAPVH